MLVVCDFGTLLDADISGIAIHDLIIPKKMLCLCNIVHVCRCNGNRVNKSIACVYFMAMHHHCVDSTTIISKPNEIVYFTVFSVPSGVTVCTKSSGHGISADANASMWYPAHMGIESTSVPSKSNKYVT